MGSYVHLLARDPVRHRLLARPAILALDLRVVLSHLPGLRRAGFPIWSVLPGYSHVPRALWPARHHASAVLDEAISAGVQGHARHRRGGHRVAAAEHAAGVHLRLGGLPHQGGHGIAWRDCYPPLCYANASVHPNLDLVYPKDLDRARTRGP